MSRHNKGLLCNRTEPEIQRMKISREEKYTKASEFFLEK